MDTPTSPVSNTVAPAPPAPGLPTGWPFSAQLATAFLLGIATTLLAVHCYRSWRGSSRPLRLEHDARTAGRLDLNRASHADLRQIPGAGDALVGRIEEQRQRVGGFRNVDELRSVRGVGPATLDRLRPWVTTDPADMGSSIATSDDMIKPSAGSRNSVGKKEASLKEPINVNQASMEELQRLPGIGPKMAQRVVDERQKRPFQSMEDLRRVSGIGAKVLEKLRPYVIVGNDAVKVETQD